MEMGPRGFVLIVVFLSLAPTEAEDSRPIRALFVRLPNDNTEVRMLLDRMKEGGFNTVIVETFYHAHTIYPSKLFPQRPEFKGSRAFEDLISLCKTRHYRVYAWIETLYWRPVIDGSPANSPEYDYRTQKLKRRAETVPSLLDQHPDWLLRTVDGKTTEQFEAQHQFVSASTPEVRRRLRDLCREIGEQFDVDGLVLDYIRGAGDHSGRARFRDSLTLRENTVSTLVSALAIAFRSGSKRRAKTGVVAACVFPEYYRHRGHSTIVQDWARWCKQGSIDLLMPMLYAHNLNDEKRDLEEVRHRTRSTRVRLVPVFAVRKNSPHFAPNVQANFVKTNGVDSFAFFSYGSLAEMPESFARIGHEVGH